MVIEENWGISSVRIEQFFRQQAEVYQIENEYGYKDCRITLTAMEDVVMNKWKFDRTKIRFEGPQEDVKEIYQKFFFRFLSAGG